MIRLIRTLRTTAFVLLGLAAAAGVARAQTTALTVTHDQDPVLQPVLQTLDLVTGTLEPVGPLGLPGGIVLTLAFLPSGELVAVDENADQLVQIDPATGQATPIGPLGVAIGSEPIDLAADACGRLWLLATVAEGSAGELFLVDPATGAAAPVGTPPEPLTGLAAAGETLYATTGSAFSGPQVLLRVDPVSAAVTPVAEVEGLPLIVELDTGPAGNLFALTANAPPIDPPIVSYDVYVFDVGGTVTGSANFGQLIPAPLGLAVGPPPGQCLGGSPLPIPAASPVGLIALALLLAAAGAWIAANRSSSAG